MTFVNLNNLADTVIIPEHPCLPDLSTIMQDSWCLLKNNRLQAVCSLWTENVPVYGGQKTAAIGNFFCEEPAAAALLLNRVCEKLKSQGFFWAIGPMNGNTWQKYRLICEAGKQPPFFMEQHTPESWQDSFVAAGFRGIADYSSARTTELIYHDPSAQKFLARNANLGLWVRGFDLEQSDSDLTRIHRLSLQSFARNFLYSKIALSDFLLMYQNIVPYVDPQYFTLAFDQNELVGFIFAIPDYAQKARGEVVDTLIIKTIAVKPGRRYAGLGSYLLQQIHQKAADNGFHSIIHAYMHDSNVSKVLSHKSAHTIRRYRLYARELSQ